jgi:hypothetical protein
MYVSLLLSFTRTGLMSPWFWGLALALAGWGFLSRPEAGEAAGEGRLPDGVAASAFAFAAVACVGYLALTKSMNARYAAFLLIYGAATLAWTKGRVAGLRARVAAARAGGGGGELCPFTCATSNWRRAARRPPLPRRVRRPYLVNGRLARALVGKRFQAPPAADA